MRAGDVVDRVITDEHAHLGPDAELAFHHLEDPLVGFGHAVVLREDHRLEVGGQPDRLGQPAAVGQQAQPVVGAQGVEAGDRVGEERRIAIAVRQVVPVVAPVVLVYCSSLIGLSIVYAAGLSFLGLGVSPPTAEWGSMLDELRPELFSHPAVAMMPALAILVVSVIFNSLGEALRRRVGAARDLRPGAGR